MWSKDDDEEEEEEKEDISPRYTLGANHHRWNIKCNCIKLRLHSVSGVSTFLHHLPRGSIVLLYALLPLSSLSFILSLFLSPPPNFLRPLDSASSLAITSLRELSRLHESRHFWIHQIRSLSFSPVAANELFSSFWDRCNSVRLRLLETHFSNVFQQVRIEEENPSVIFTHSLFRILSSL